MRKCALLVTLALAVVTLFAATAAPASARYSYSPGYWMNHPEAWSSGGVWIVAPTGEDTDGCWYNRDDAIQWMRTPPRGDKSITAFFIVTAASLDVYNAWGGDRADAFAAAGDWVMDHPPGSGVTARSTDWKAIEPSITFLASTFE